MRAEVEGVEGEGGEEGMRIYLGGRGRGEGVRIKNSFMFLASFAHPCSSCFCPI